LSPWTSIPAALPPLVGFVLALCGLWLGWRTVHKQAIPPLLRPLLHLNAVITATFLNEQAAQRQKAEALSPRAVRLYGWAWVYAGTLGVIIAGGQLLRLLAHTLG